MEEIEEELVAGPLAGEREDMGWTSTRSVGETKILGGRKTAQRALPFSSFPLLDFDFSHRTWLGRGRGAQIPP